jgi:hypothetical protein
MTIQEKLNNIRNGLKAWPAALAWAKPHLDALELEIVGPDACTDTIDETTTGAYDEYN